MPTSAAVAARWQRLEAEIQTRYKGLRHLKTAAAAELLATPGIVVLDVRAANEFAVSHLRGARNLAAADLPAQLTTVGKNTPILVYCSVGYRSAAAAQQLTEAGYTAVHNYLGSLFAWANAGRVLVDAVGETAEVHPYNTDWGQLLGAHLHRYTPRER